MNIFLIKMIMKKKGLSYIIQTSICLSQVGHKNGINAKRIKLKSISFSILAIIGKLRTITMNKLENKRSKNIFKYEYNIMKILYLNEYILAA